MKTVINPWHRLGNSGAEILTIFALLVLVYGFYKAMRWYHDYKYRALFPLIGQKTEDGYDLLIKKRKGNLEIRRCDHSLTLSKLQEKTELIETHTHLKIGKISEVKRGWSLWKKSVYILHTEQRTENFVFDPTKLNLNPGDWYFGRSLVGKAEQIENADRGAFSARILGSSGSGKTMFCSVIARSWIEACLRNNEPFVIFVNDPKTSYLWAKKCGAVISNGTMLTGAQEFLDHINGVYNNVLNISETLKANDIHVRHVNELSKEQREKLGIHCPKVLIIAEEYERYWSSDRQAQKPTKDSSQEIKDAWELMNVQDRAQVCLNNLLAIGRAFGVSILASTQSALVSSANLQETNFQITGASRISPEASGRLFQDRMLATDTNCKVGEFIVKSDQGIRKVQVPLFNEDKA